MNEHKSSAEYDPSRGEIIWKPSKEIPDFETLALIAASVSKNGTRDRNEAIAYALEVWRAAARFVIQRKVRPDEPHIEIHILALLAASVSRGLGKDAAMKAVNYAMGLWSNAHRVTLEIEKQETNSLLVIPLPSGFPAKLGDFLRIVIKGRTLAQSMERLRGYVRYRLVKWQDTYSHRDKRPFDDQVESFIKGFDTWNLFASAKEWEKEGRRYRQWYADKCSLVRKAAGSKGGKSKAARHNSQAT